MPVICSYFNGVKEEIYFSAGDRHRDIQREYAKESEEKIKYLQQQKMENSAIKKQE
jgi:hypothetical protein